MDERDAFVPVDNQGSVVTICDQTIQTASIKQNNNTRIVVTLMAASTTTKNTSS